MLRRNTLAPVYLSRSSSNNRDRKASKEAIFITWTQDIQLLFLLFSNILHFVCIIFDTLFSVWPPN